MSQWFEKILEDVDKLDVFNEDTHKAERGRGKISKTHQQQVPVTEDIHVTSNVVEEVVHHQDIEQGGLVSNDNLSATGTISTVLIGSSSTAPDVIINNNSDNNMNGDMPNFGQYVNDSSELRREDGSTINYRDNNDDYELGSKSMLNNQPDESDIVRENQSHATSVFRDFIVSSSNMIANSLPEFGEEEQRNSHNSSSSHKKDSVSLAKSLYSAARAAAAIGTFDPLDEEEDVDDFEYNDPILKKIQANKERMMSGRQLSYALGQSDNQHEQQGYAKPPCTPDKGIDYLRYDLSTSGTASKNRRDDGENGSSDHSITGTICRSSLSNGYLLFRSDGLPGPSTAGERYHDNNLLLLICFLLYGCITFLVDKITGRSTTKSVGYISLRMTETREVIQNRWLQSHIWEQWWSDMDIITAIEYLTSPYGFGVLTFLLLYYMYFKFGRYRTDVIDV